MHDKQPRGLLRLGAIESTAAIRLPEPLIEFHRRYPDVKLELRTGVQASSSAAVLAGELDAALVVEPVADAPFEKLRCSTRSWCSSPRPTMRRSARRATSVGNRAGIRGRLPLPPAAEAMVRARPAKCPARIVEMSSYHAMLGCAVAGMGIALLCRGSVTDDVPQRTFLKRQHPLPPELDHALTVLIWRKGARSPKIVLP